MCGIAGFYSLSSSNLPPHLSPKTLGTMLDLIAHRGPDDRGTTTDESYGLGHVRLSILDTSSHGHQPMWCPENRYCLVYNGEIYNFKVLRRDLEQRGYAFQSASDSEVLLHGLREWGTDVFAKLEGMFAGAFLDTQDNTLIVFRDQLGIKPFYYTMSGDVFAFASEAKALRPALSSLSLNESALYESFHFRFVSGQRTMYQGVQKLSAGTFLTLKPDQEPVFTSYYSVLDRLSDHGSEAADLDAIEAKLRESITAHTVSDVGYSVQLSGGIDSSYITTVLSESAHDLDTFSVTLPGDQMDEAPYQDIVVKQCGTRHHSYPCSAKEFADLLPEVIYHLDYPVVHTGTVFLYLLCRHIGQTHKVVLTGEGADELFLGYSRYALPLSHRLLFQAQRRGITLSSFPDLPKVRGVKQLLQKDWGLDAGNFDSEIWDDFLKVQRDTGNREAIAGRYQSLLGRMMASDQTSYLESLLERQDKISMAHGVEVRVPFCNHHLFDMVNPIRHSLKQAQTPKALLKNILSKHYSNDFVYRPKNGFKLPIAQWFRDPKGLGRYLDYLRDETFRTRSYFDRSMISRILDDHLKGRKDYSKELLGLVGFEIWLRQSAS